MNQLLSTGNQWWFHYSLWKNYEGFC